MIFARKNTFYEHGAHCPHCRSALLRTVEHAERLTSNADTTTRQFRFEVPRRIIFEVPRRSYLNFLKKKRRYLRGWPFFSKTFRKSADFAFGQMKCPRIVTRFRLLLRHSVYLNFQKVYRNEGIFQIHLLNFV